jgi:hypothetical protein
MTLSAHDQNLGRRNQLRAAEVGVASRILVTGASGQIGREVVAQLSAAGLPVRALTRKPQTGSFPDGVEVVGGDFTAPETLDDALRDVAVVFLVWVAPLAFAARGSSASPLRNTSFFCQLRFERTTRSSSSPMRSGSCTQPSRISSRRRDRVDNAAPGAICAQLPQLVGTAASERRCRALVSRGAAQTAAVHERDIAAVAVRALCEQRHHGRDYVLTGPESLTQREQLAIIGAAIGRTLTFDGVSPDLARQKQLALESPLHFRGRARVFQTLWTNYLDRDRNLELSVPRLIDRAHAANAEHANDVISPEVFPDR